jgi:hypothetical protein
MSAGESQGHGTGYEDAIARRIAAAETEAKQCAERLARATATIEELTRDNASLRVRAREAEAKARRMGLFVALAALVALGVLAGAVYLLFVTPGR